MKRGVVGVVNLLESDFFTIFDLEPAFELDLAFLDKQYFALQKTYHKSAHARLINTAYGVLKSTLKRAEYLLSLNNIIVNAQENNSYLLPPKMLEQVLEQREVLSQLTTNYEEYLAKIQAEKTLLIAQIAINFDEKNYQQAAINTIYLRYLDKLVQEIEKEIDQ
jgi:molecular chaperone HscB